MTNHRTAVYVSRYGGRISTVTVLYCHTTALTLTLTIVIAIAIMTPKQINFITGNKNKLIESKAILGDIVDLQSQALDLVEIQGTIEQISTDKCRRAAEYVSLLCARSCNSLT